jgi:hypothetical protein
MFLAKVILTVLVVVTSIMLAFRMVQEAGVTSIDGGTPSTDYEAEARSRQWHLIPIVLVNVVSAIALGVLSLVDTQK